MISVVIGFMRSGTSAMMQALIAGGMDAAYSAERNQLAEAKADTHYHPNKSGLYEVSLTEYLDPSFPLSYQGKLIKIMAWADLAVNSQGYRVVLLRRDREEIRQSYEAFFCQPLKMPWFGQYEDRMDRLEALLWNRRDVQSVTCLEYRNVVTEPAATMWQLVADGWPIDPDKAALAIDPAQCRFRRELLTVGI